MGGQVHSLLVHSLLCYGTGYFGDEDAVEQACGGAFVLGGVAADVRAVFGSFAGLECDDSGVDDSGDGDVPLVTAAFTHRHDIAFGHE